MADYAFTSALRSVREGMSARAGLTAFRAGGGSVRDSVWFRSYAEARSTLAARADEVGRPLNRRPTGDERRSITEWKGDPRVLQQVEVLYRVRGEDEIQRTWFTVTSDRGVTRQRAIDQAIDWFDQGVAEGSPPGEVQVLLGAVHTGAYQPGG